MFTVVGQAQIPAPVAQTWLYLTRPSLIAKWFADADRFAPGEPFRLEFGDGDFFAGAVEQWQEPVRLCLRWRLMGIGPQFEISYILTPLPGEATELSVIDAGALSLEEVESLREGWTDFLGRLATFAATGESSRYSWSETIGFGAILKNFEDDGWPAEMNDDGWWNSIFVGAGLEIKEHSNSSLAINFSDQAWGDARTEALLKNMRSDAGIYIGLAHEGWKRLPGDKQVAERRRYAGLWLTALQALEQRYG
ncbi:MAG TPA: SRPBCC domain-containing protein [Blastocatellia bacterium]|jgi:uncharacterized protein YndB with AHSA1/START domain